MSVLDLGRLSASVAESVVTTLWRILEEYDIASPRIEVASYGSGLVALRFAFDEAEAAKRVQCALRRLMPEIGGDAELR